MPMVKKEQKVEMLIPKVDVVFQSLFSKNHPRITKAFAEALLEEKEIREIIIKD